MKLSPINHGEETNALLFPSLGHKSALNAAFRRDFSAFHGLRGSIGPRWNEIVVCFYRGIGAPAMNEPALIQITAQRIVISPVRRQRWPRD